MPSTSEKVIEGVRAMVAAALPGFEVGRNTEGPEAIPPGGMVIIRDGDAGEPDVTLSPLTYHYAHAVRVEVVVIGATPEERSARLDSALMQIGAAVEADRSLNGLCEWLAPADEQPAREDFHAEGGETGRVADLDIIASYSTPNPLI